MEHLIQDRIFAGFEAVFQESISGEATGRLYGTLSQALNPWELV